MSSSAQSHSMNQNQKQKKMKVKEGDNPFLPEEIITNILKRLPVKSLIRFKCVCKHWENLIKTPSFIHEHLHHPSNNQNPFLLFSDLSPHWSWHLYLLDYEMKVLEVSCDSLFDIQLYREIIGSSNGLLCIKHKYPSCPILLWNPAIRQVRLVPKPKPANNCFAGSFLNLGFGFSSVVNDYKILAIYDTIPNVLDYHVEVYSLKTGLWKKVESSPLKGFAILRGSFAAHGSIFWLGFKHNVEGKVHMLVSYDMALEVFTLMPSPVSPLKTVDSVSTCLTIHENKLAILSHTFIGNPVSSLIDLWVMEDGTGKSVERCGWTKKFSISHPFLSVARTIWRNKMVCLPRCNGATEVDMLGDGRKSIALVNLTTSEFNMSAIFKYGRPLYFLNYVESLVPVSNDDIEEL